MVAETAVVAEASVAVLAVMAEAPVAVLAEASVAVVASGRGIRVHKNQTRDVFHSNVQKSRFDSKSDHTSARYSTRGV